MDRSAVSGGLKPDYLLCPSRNSASLLPLPFFPSFLHHAPHFSPSSLSIKIKARRQFPSHNVAEAASSSRREAIASGTFKSEPFCLR
uniref:Uncharacterized protein MANES_12G118700 n=1 Tax=Rhizophora mucronata TaxID=61149 RepID=A0A2P2KDI5_RHIMU